MTEGHRTGDKGTFLSTPPRSPCSSGTEDPPVGTRQAAGEMAEPSKALLRVLSQSQRLRSGACLGAWRRRNSTGLFKNTGDTQGLADITKGGSRGGYRAVRTDVGSKLYSLQIDANTDIICARTSSGQRGP